MHPPMSMLEQGQQSDLKVNTPRTQEAGVRDGYQDRYVTLTTDVMP